MVIVYYLSFADRVAVLDKVTDFLLFLGKILVAGGVGKLMGFFQCSVFWYLQARHVYMCLADS